MFDRLKDALFTRPLPYFMPEDDSLLQLPGSSELKS
jgi:hypothetical protein